MLHLGIMKGLFPLTCCMLQFFAGDGGKGDEDESEDEGKGEIDGKSIEELVKKEVDKRDEFWKKKIGLEHKETEKLRKQVAQFKAGGEHATELETELDEYKGRFEKANTELQSANDEITRLKGVAMSNAIMSVVAKEAHKLYEGASEDLADKMAKYCDEQDGKVIVKGADGRVRYSGKRDADGNFVPMTLAELAAEILESKPNWLKPTSTGGGGEDGNTEGVTKLVSVEKYNSWSAADRAAYRAKLTDEQKQQLFNQ